MHMIRSTIIGQIPKKELKSTNISTEWTPINQENKSNNHSAYKPTLAKYSHGIGLSLKTSQNRESQVPNKQSFSSQQNVDRYLQKVMKSNLQKMSHMRGEFEKQKQSLLNEAKILKKQNGVLKSKIQQLKSQMSRSQFLNTKQLSEDFQARQQTTPAYLKHPEPNPEKIYEGWTFLKQMRQKTEKLTKQVQNYKELNTQIQSQNSKLNLTIQKLQKQSIVNQNQLQNCKNNQKTLRNQLQSLRREIQFNKQIEAKRQLQQKIRSQLKNQNRQKQKSRDKNRKSAKAQNVVQFAQKQMKLGKQKSPAKRHPSEIHPSKKDSSVKFSQKYSGELVALNDFHKNGQLSLVDKRLLKNLQSQLKSRQSRIYEKDALIDELNAKILSNGLIGLNNKYKYLMKA